MKLSKKLIGLISIGLISISALCIKESIASDQPTHTTPSATVNPTDSSPVTTEVPTTNTVIFTNSKDTYKTSILKNDYYGYEYSYADNQLIISTLDGETVKKIDFLDNSDDIIRILWVDNSWMYYYDTPYNSMDDIYLCRVPLNDKNDSFVEKDKKEKLLQLASNTSILDAFLIENYFYYIDSYMGVDDDNYGLYRFDLDTKKTEIVCNEALSLIYTDNNRNIPLNYQKNIVLTNDQLSSDENFKLYLYSIENNTITKIYEASGETPWIARDTDEEESSFYSTFSTWVEYNEELYFSPDTKNIYKYSENTGETLCVLTQEELSQKSENIIDSPRKLKLFTDDQSLINHFSSEIYSVQIDGLYIRSGKLCIAEKVTWFGKLHSEDSKYHYLDDCAVLYFDMSTNQCESETAIYSIIDAQGNVKTGEKYIDETSDKTHYYASEQSYINDITEDSIEFIYYENGNKHSYNYFYH